MGGLYILWKNPLPSPAHVYIFINANSQIITYNTDIKRDILIDTENSASLVLTVSSVNREDYLICFKSRKNECKIRIE